RQAVRVPPREGPDLVQRERLLLALAEHGEVVQDQIPALLQARLARQAACAQGRDLAEDPGGLDRRSADPDAVASSRLEESERVGGRLDVAVAADRYRQNLLQTADTVPVGAAPEHLARGPRVHGDGVRPLPFADAAELKVIRAPLIQTDA